MKLILFFTAILACIFIQTSAFGGASKRIECFKNVDAYQTRIYENKIREELEKLRKQLKEGIPSLNIPPMDPLILEEKHINIDHKLIKLNLNTTGRVDGLLGFDLQKLKIALIGLKFDFTLNFPAIEALGKYGINATAAKLSFFGNGDLDTKATSLTITGNGKLKTKLSSGKLVILIDHITVDVLLQEFFLNITGLYDDEDLSKFISESLTEALPQILQDVKNDINKLLEIAVELINKYLEKNGGLLPHNALNAHLIQCANL